MKKQVITAALVSALLLGSCPAAFAADGAVDMASAPAAASAADDAATAAEDVQDGENTAAKEAEESVTETPIVTDLSLEEAIRIMQTTGTSAETAELNKQSDQALARSYKETVQSIREAFDNLDQLQTGLNFGVVTPQQYMSASVQAELAGATTANEKIMKLRRDFANAHIESNYQAELNGIEYTTVQLYYGVLLASDNLKIAQDNLETQKEILKNTQTQLQVGMVAKKDVLAAQSAVESAKSDVQAAQTKLSDAKMSFNFLLGYPVTQKINFTDQLTAITGPEENVEIYVEQALKNRMELSGAEYAKQVHGMLLESLRYRYPMTSSTYLSQQVAYMNAAKVAKDAPSKIEIDIRTQYAAIQDAKAAMESAKVTQSYAQEGYRLTNLSYQAGMCTLPEVQAAQVTAYKAGLGVAAATSEYDLAVYQFKYATGTGTSRLPF